MSQEHDPEFGYLPISLIAAAAVDDLAMTDHLLRVYVALGSYASKRNDHWCWPTQEQIAKRMGISRQEVGQACARLVELGYIEMRHHFREDGAQLSNSYRVLKDFVLPRERDRSSAPRPREGIGGRPRKPTPPETALSFTPPETPRVSPPETPRVSPPETQLSFTSESGKIRRKNKTDASPIAEKPKAEQRQRLASATAAVADRPHPAPRPEPSPPPPPPAPDDWPPPEPPDDDWPPPVGEIGQNLPLLSRWRVSREGRAFMAGLIDPATRKPFDLNTHSARALMFAYIEWQRERRALAGTG